MRRKLANLVESFLAIRGQFDQILFFFEGLANPEAGGFLIIDDENAGGSSGWEGTPCQARSNCEENAVIVSR